MFSDHFFLMHQRFDDKVFESVKEHRQASFCIIRVYIRLLKPFVTDRRIKQ